MPSLKNFANGRWRRAGVFSFYGDEACPGRMTDCGNCGGSGWCSACEGSGLCLACNGRGKCKLEY